MRNNASRNLKKIVLIIAVIFLLVNERTQAQRALPRMWVPKAVCVERKLWFRFGALNPGDDSKERILSKIIKAPKHTLSYPLPTKSIFDLISNIIRDNGNSKPNGLRVYLAAFDISHPGPLSSSKIRNKQLLLIFAPAGTLSSDADLGKYYIIHPEDFTCHEIGGVKSFWIDNYRNNVASAGNGLASTLEQTVTPENTDANGGQSDTWGIFYKYADFEDFFDKELQYQLKNNEPRLSGIEADFASYSDIGIDASAEHLGKNAYKNRLIIQFEFTRNINGKDEIFYVDDQPDFGDRVKQTAKNAGVDYKIILEKRGGDNGQLCPPSSNCPTERK